MSRYTPIQNPHYIRNSCKSIHYNGRPITSSFLQCPRFFHRSLWLCSPGLLYSCLHLWVLRLLKAVHYRM